MAETTPFEHKVIPRHIEFRTAAESIDIAIYDIYAALVGDTTRNEMIAADLIRAVEAGRSPLLLTGRTEHLEYFAAKLNGAVLSTSLSSRVAWEKGSGGILLMVLHQRRNMRRV